MNSPAPRKHTYLVFMVLLVIFLLVATEMYFGFLKPHVVAHNVKIHGIYLAQPQATPNFSLTGSNGKIFTQENLHHHWTLMFFGFTNCSMVCPTTMAALAAMYKDLEKNLSQEDLPQVVMVSVDPERDTMQRLHDYVIAFHPQFLGARTSLEATTRLEKQLHIAAAKLQAAGGKKDQYTINHSTEILLFNPAGQLQAFLSAPYQAKAMADDYQLILQTTLRTKK